MTRCEEGYPGVGPGAGGIPVGEGEVSVALGPQVSTPGGRVRAVLETNS